MNAASAAGSGSSGRLGFNATWSMAIGGIVGGAFTFLREIDADGLAGSRAGALAAAAATLALIVRLVRTDPIAIAFLAVLVLVAVFGRPLLLRHFATRRRHE